MNQAYWGNILDPIRQQQPQQSRYEQRPQQQPQQQPQLPLPPGGRLPPIQSAHQPDPELQKRLLETLDKPPLPPLKPKPLPSLNGGRRRSKKSDTTKKSKTKSKSKSRSRISTKRKKQKS